MPSLLRIWPVSQREAETSPVADRWDAKTMPTSIPPDTDHCPKMFVRTGVSTQHDLNTN
jgi:hypothetical protein